MQKIPPSMWTALVKPRVSDEAYMRGMAARRERNACPLCDGARFVTSHDGAGRQIAQPCECEIARAGQARLTYSGLTQYPAQTFDNFDPAGDLAEVRDLARQFAEALTHHHVLTIKGGFGTGKTHLLQAIGWVSLEHGRQPKFVSVARYLDKLRATFADDSPVSFEAVYRPLEAAQMLLLDDLGAERLTNWGQEQLYKMVNYRYQERLPMAVSMNLDEKQAVDVYGGRTADRLLDTGSGRVRMVSTGSSSYRTGR